MSQTIPVLVTTQHRGVFFGRVPADADLQARSMTLTGCRNAIQWKGGKGFLSLASDGPIEGCRIGATAPSVLLHDITSVSLCSEAAAAKWESWA